MMGGLIIFYNMSIVSLRLFLAGVGGVLLFLLLLCVSCGD